MKGRNFDKTTTYHEMRGSFEDVLKRGIYKELHQRKVLSDGQLCILLKTK